MGYMSRASKSGTTLNKTVTHRYKMNISGKSCKNMSGLIAIIVIPECPRGYIQIRVCSYDIKTANISDSVYKVFCV
jgi:hypothetical protein